MNPIIIPMTKKVVSEVPHGEMKITIKDNSYYLEYFNPLYIGSPFKVPQQFSTTLSIETIMNSGEVASFMGRFK